MLRESMSNRDEHGLHIRILYVDDNPDDLALFRRAIDRTCPGCLLEEAGDPVEAMLLLNRKTADELPQAIITDGSFHCGDAATFIKRLRKDFARIPVIALSARDDQETVNRTYEAGASAYLVKSAGFEELLETVRILTSFLERSRLPS